MEPPHNDGSEQSHTDTHTHTQRNYKVNTASSCEWAATRITAAVLPTYIVQHSYDYYTTIIFGITLLPLLT